MKYLFIITLALILDRAHAQQADQTAGIPGVFLIGEYEENYLELSQQHPEVFIALFNNDIDRAYKGWSEFLMDIEDYATEIDFDIRGIKMWLNVYFNKDGSISNLAFYPKPNSRNVPNDHLVAFFKNFIRQYKFTETSTEGYYHSASAAFPTFFHRTTPVTAKGN